MDRRNTMDSTKKCRLIKVSFQMNLLIFFAILSLICPAVQLAKLQRPSDRHDQQAGEERSSSSRRWRGPIPAFNFNKRRAPALQTDDILSRLDAAATFRDNLVRSLGRVLLLCLEEEVRVPFEVIHEAFRVRRVATYDLLPILPILKNSREQDQLYVTMRALEERGGPLVSSYATLCEDALSYGWVNVKSQPKNDLLTGISEDIIASIEQDEHRKDDVPSTLDEAESVILGAIAKNTLPFKLPAIAALMKNTPSFDLTYPEVSGSIRFVAAYLTEQSMPEEPLFKYIRPKQVTSAEKLIKMILRTLEMTQMLDAAIREDISILLQHLRKPLYLTKESESERLLNLLSITSDHYPCTARASARFIRENLKDSDIADLGIAFDEDDDHALLQLLSGLRDKPNLGHLERAISLLVPFVFQNIKSQASHELTWPGSKSQLKEYLNTLSTPCLPAEMNEAVGQLITDLHDDVYSEDPFVGKTKTNHPWEALLNALVKLRRSTVSEKQARLMDNVIYQLQSREVIRKPDTLRDYGLIFKRDDSQEIEVDLYSLLMRIPNIFRHEDFTPMLNFFSRANILQNLGKEFNKFAYDTPRDLLLGILKKVRSLPRVMLHENLMAALNQSQQYLEQPYLINLYTSEYSQALFNELPLNEEDSRYLPLKILLRKRKLFNYISPTFRMDNLTTPRERVNLILRTLMLKPLQPHAFDSVMFAINNLNGCPLPLKRFDRTDFVYLTNELLSHYPEVRDQILHSTAYSDVVPDWDISVSGEPEVVLVRALYYPVEKGMADAKLSATVREAEKLLEGESFRDVETLKMKMLETMLTHLPMSMYLKPLYLLLKKANLMTIVPKLNLQTLEKASPRDALIMMLENLQIAPLIKAEHPLLKRVRVALSLINATVDPEHNLLSSYLVQAISDPFDPVYEPLIQSLKNLTIVVSLDKRDAWLKSYLNRTMHTGKTEELRQAAKLALTNMTYGHDSDPTWQVNKQMIAESLSILPHSSNFEPIRKLFKSSMILNMLPPDFNAKDYEDKEELLKALLHIVKQRADTAEDPSLMKAIDRTEKILGGWRNNAQGFKQIVRIVKLAIYDPIKRFVTVEVMDKIKFDMPSDSNESSKTMVLRLLRTLMQNPRVNNNDKVMQMLNVIKEDISMLGLHVDLLNVLDVRGLNSTELGPLRLYLSTSKVTDEYGPSIFKIQNRKEQFDTLVQLLSDDDDVKSNEGRWQALKILENYRSTSYDTSVTDLMQITESTPHRIEEKYKNVTKHFTTDTLSPQGNKDKITTAKNRCINLLSKMTKLPKAAPSRMKRFITPILNQIEHVQQINIDYMDQLIDSNVLSYLNLPEIKNAENDVEILQIIVQHLLFNYPSQTDEEMLRHLESFERALRVLLSYSTAKVPSNATHLMEILQMIPDEEKYAPIRNFMKSDEAVNYISKETDWSKFKTPYSKVIHFLTNLAEYDLPSHVVFDSAMELREYLINTFDFIKEHEIKSLLATLNSVIKLPIDITPLKLFMNHANLIKYLPRDFRYSNYTSPEHALFGVIEKLSNATGVTKKHRLYELVRHVKKFLEEDLTAKQLRSAEWTTKGLRSEDLRFVELINVTSAKLRTFLGPQHLIDILPKTFSFSGYPTFKTKATHLLLELLSSESDVYVELEELLRQVQLYPDVPNITKDDLQRILNVMPGKYSQHVPHVSEYLTPSILTRLLPGTFEIHKFSDARGALHDILLLLQGTIEDMSEETGLAIDIIADDLGLLLTNPKPVTPVQDENSIASLIAEIPFDEYQQIKGLKKELSAKKILQELPMNFRLDLNHCRKQQLLSLLLRLSDTAGFRPFAQSIKLAASIVEEMPDIQKIVDTDIKETFAIIPLSEDTMMQLLKSCNVDTMAPYLPINFDFEKLHWRKEKAPAMIQYCKMASSDKEILKVLTDYMEPKLVEIPMVDVTQDEINFYLQHINYEPYLTIKPLITYFYKNDVAKYLPWNVDTIPLPTAKETHIQVLDALKNLKVLQNKTMLDALDALKANAQLLEDTFPDDIVNEYVQQKTALSFCKFVDKTKCAEIKDYLYNVTVLKKILPSTIYCGSCPQKRHLTPTGIDQQILLSGRYAPRIKSHESVKESWRQSMFGLTKLVTHIYHDELHANHCDVDPLVKMAIFGFNHWDLYQSAPVFNIEEAYAWFTNGTRYQCRRGLQAAQHTKWASKSKALHDAFEWSFLRNNQDAPGDFYGFEYAILHIPNDSSYDSFRLYLRNAHVRLLVRHVRSRLEHTSARVLWDLLQLLLKEKLDQETKDSIERFNYVLSEKLISWTIEKMFETLPEYNARMDEGLNGIKSYYLSGSQNDEAFNALWETFNPKFENKLTAAQTALLALPQLKTLPELQRSLTYLQQLQERKIKFDSPMNRSADDINLEALVVALPRIRDERLILGFVKFFSTPQLLQRLRLPENPYSYKTTGHLLQMILDHGQRLPTVREDPDQQDALLYFRDKLIMDGPGAGPIEVKKCSKTTCMDLDVVGLLQAVNLTDDSLHASSKMLVFFLTKYDKFLHSAGFDQSAFVNRGTYLKAFLHHLAGNLQVPDDVRGHAKSLIPYVTLNGFGARAIVFNHQLFGTRMMENVIHEDLNVRAKSNSEIVIPRNPMFLDFSSVPKDILRVVDGLKASVHNLVDSFLPDSDLPENIDGTRVVIATKRRRIHNPRTPVEDDNGETDEDRWNPRLSAARDRISIQPDEDVDIDYDDTAGEIIAGRMFNDSMKSVKKDSSQILNRKVRGIRTPKRDQDISSRNALPKNRNYIVDRVPRSTYSKKIYIAPKTKKYRRKDLSHLKMEGHYISG